MIYRALLKGHGGYKAYRVKPNRKWKNRVYIKVHKNDGWNRWMRKIMLTTNGPKEKGRWPKKWY
jgi:hypothetical protein